MEFVTMSAEEIDVEIAQARRERPSAPAEQAHA